MNIFVPTLVGAIDMSFPRLNNLSFWLLFSSLILASSSMMIGEGIGTGWTVKTLNKYKRFSNLTNKEKEKFYLWLVGFTDGDGSFVIYKNKNTYGLKFSLSQSTYNLKLLYYIKAQLNYGNISIEKRSYNNKNTIMASLNIYDRKLLKTIIFPIFDKYPLLTSKYFNYIKFKKAWFILEDNNLTQKEKNSKIELLLKEELPINYISPALINLTKDSDYTLIQNTISIYWLIGFTEAEGNFLISKNNLNSYKISYNLTQKLDYLLLYLIKRLLHIPGKIYVDSRNINNLITSNSRVIWYIIDLFNNKLKGVKSLEFKLWSRAKYYNDTKNYKKIEKILIILNKIRSKL